MSLIKNAKAMLLISLSYYYPSLEDDIDTSHITPQHSLFLYRLMVFYCKHVKFSALELFLAIHVCFGVQG